MTDLTSPLERSFEIDELFFSATDAKGFIRSANSVFDHVSGYGPQEYRGVAHNLVRHPDMPRVVFRLLWGSLKDQQPIVAYVKNLAKDGRHYWVLALAFPADGEYISVRLKPTSPIFPMVRDLYAILVEHERVVEATHGRSAAMDAAERRLLDELKRLGYPTYEQFMWHALATEVAARRGVLPEFAARNGGGGSVVDTTLQTALTACQEVFADLEKLAKGLDSFEQLAAEFRHATTFLADLADEVGLFALNAGLSADRSGSRAAVLQSIANLMRVGAVGVEGDVRDLSGELDRATTQVRHLAFAVSAAELALEMATDFLRDLDHDAADDPRAFVDTAGLLGSIVGNMDTAAHLLGGLDQLLFGLTTPLGHLLSHLGELRILRLRAEIDAAGDPAARQFAAIIAQVEERLAEGADAVNDLLTKIAAARVQMRSIDASKLRHDSRRLGTVHRSLTSPGTTVRLLDLHAVGA